MKMRYRQSVNFDRGGGGGRGMVFLCGCLEDSVGCRREGFSRLSLLNSSKGAPKYTLFAQSSISQQKVASDLNKTVALKIRRVIKKASECGPYSHASPALGLGDRYRPGSCS